MKNQKIKTLALALMLTLAWGCSNEQEDTDPQTPDNTEEENTDGVAGATVWNGGTMTFAKEAGTDPGDEANQDRITDNVWITRGNDGGQIFNIASESVSDKGNSPAGTQWAIGDLSNASNLTFSNFRTTVGSPKDVVGKNLVLYIPDDNVVMSVSFTSWSQGKQGGFSYTRSIQ